MIDWRYLAARLHLVHHLSCEAIAEELGISLKRVRMHLDSAFRSRVRKADAKYRKKHAYEIKLRKVAREEKRETKTLQEKRARTASTPQRIEMKQDTQ